MSLYHSLRAMAPPYEQPAKPGTAPATDARQRHPLRSMRAIESCTPFCFRRPKLQQGIRAQKRGEKDKSSSPLTSYVAESVRVAVSVVSLLAICHPLPGCGSAYGTAGTLPARVRTLVSPSCWPQGAGPLVFPGTRGRPRGTARVQKESLLGQGGNAPTFAIFRVSSKPGERPTRASAFRTPAARPQSGSGPRCPSATAQRESLVVLGQTH